MGRTDIVCGVCETRISLNDAFDDLRHSEELLQSAHAWLGEINKSIQVQGQRLSLVGQFTAFCYQRGIFLEEFPREIDGIAGEVHLRNASDTQPHASAYIVFAIDRVRSAEVAVSQLNAVNDPSLFQRWAQSKKPVLLCYQYSSGSYGILDARDYLRTEDRRRRRHNARIDDLQKCIKESANPEPELRRELKELTPKLDVPVVNIPWHGDALSAESIETLTLKGNDDGDLSAFARRPADVPPAI